MLLNDEIFWSKFVWFCLSDSHVKRLREYRTKWFIPKKKFLKTFIEDYKIISWDDRPANEIDLWLRSPAETK